MKPSHLLLPIMAASLLAAQPVSAQEVRYGFQATIAKPEGDLSTAMDGQVGFGLGIHALIDLKGGHAILPRLDYTTYKHSSNGLDENVKVLSLGADYDYFTGGKANAGFYLLGGLGYASTKDELTFPGGSAQETKGSLYMNLGAGWDFSPHVGVELRYNHSTISESTGSIAVPSLQASLVIRF